MTNLRKGTNLESQLLVYILQMILRNVIHGMDVLRLTRGDTFAISADTDSYRIVPEGKVKLVEVAPGEDMKRKHV